MKTITKIFSFFLIAIAALFSQTSVGQSVMLPTDPIVVYNPATPPTQPVWGQIGKWVKTNRLSWNTNLWKAYIYKGNPFRLVFPKTYNPTANDGKKYPIIVFFHGRGEAGSIYDNEFSLLHGGENFKNKVDNGTFDGYILVMQTTNGYHGDPQFDAVKEITDYMIINNKLDPFRIVDNGLSTGGAATWDMAIRHPSVISSMLPMSMSSVYYQTANVVNSLKYTPIWIFQGGLDGSPAPYTTEQVRNAFLNAGGNFKYTLYPNIAHDTWNAAWAEADFFPFANRAYKSNPWTLFGRTEFCPGDVINVTLGLTPGLQAYQWRKNGVVIGGSTSNTLQVTTLGTYDARVQRNGIWSDWSRIPVEIKLKAATVSPTITIPALKSKVIPALDGSTSVNLQVPAGYASYLWQQVGNSTTLGTSNTYNVNSGGDYHVRVTEQFGCSGNFTTPFTVVNANGPNKPDPATGLAVTTLSKTSLRLDWNSNPVPQYNETNFEIYRAASVAGPFTLVAITNPDISTYNIEGLTAKTTYFFKIRSVNNTGAAVASNVASGTTDSDTQAPTAPTGLQITGTSKNSVSLSWTASTDDVAVIAYDIYVNNQKVYFTDQINYTVYNLQQGVSYNFAVKARDFANNVSPFSNQVTGQALANGLNYKYYTFTGTWNSLPNFNTLTPDATGIMPNIALTPRTQNDNFAFLWEGSLNVTQAGTYRFRTNSDDGSRLYLDTLNSSGSPYNFSATPLVNNDGLHGSKDVTSGNVTLAVGSYPIAMTFYEQGGGERMVVSWNRNGGSFSTIPNSAFADAPVNNGSAPNAPGALSATALSHKAISLAWSDLSNNETGFEIWRSTNAISGYTTIGTSAPNTAAYIDSNNLNPNTTYHYKIRSIGQYGESELIGGSTGSADVQANWKFNNNYNDASGNNKTLTPNSAPTFSTDKQEGTHAVEMNGSNEDMDVNTAAGDYLRGGYTAKTVSFWMKSDNNGGIFNGGIRGIFDFGGSDDGLAMALYNNQLYAGVANNSSRKSINSSYSSSAWNHIAVVYSVNTLRIYVNGVQAVANTNLGYNSVGTTSDASRIGDDNGNNALNSSFGQFDGKLDDFYIIGKALSASEIVNLMNGVPLPQSNATTLQLPGIPTVPAALLASGVSSSQINVTWTDAANETTYGLFRSGNNNSNYVLIATLPANTVSYSDTGLFSNSVFYYKIRSQNAGGNSAFSNEDSAKTVNTPPVVTAIATQYMRFGTTLNLPVEATDRDPEVITLQVTNLPSFASFTPGASGTGVISFVSTASGDQNTYNNITVTATDQNGGSHVATFTLVVNNNFNPELNTVGNVTVNEKQVPSPINLSATDANGDPLTWVFTGLPDFAASTPNGNNAQISLTPGYSDAGIYNVLAKVTDGNGGFDTTSFVITVNNVNPNKKTYINFNNGAIVGASPWNNTSRLPALNADWPALKDEFGATGAIGMKIVSDWANMGYGDGTNDYGVNTGNNSGVYPDNVMRTAYFTNQNPQSIQLYGLDPTFKYNFTMFGSRGSVNDDRTTIFTVGASSVSLQTANNRQNTATLSNLQPNPDGTLTLTLSKGPASPFGYLNTLVIESKFDDLTVPVKPRNIAAQFGNNEIAVSWTAGAYNANGYTVYRATNPAGPFTSLNPGANNPAQELYNDAAIAQNITYYYYVRGFNNYGLSPSSDTVSVAVPNVAPIVANIANVTMNALQVQNVNVSATDGAGDAITLSASNLPAFATFTDNGNGTGVVHLAPTASHVGTHSGVTITATDNFNGVSFKSFNITVAYANSKNVFVNFNDGSAAQPPQGTPWNNMNGIPTANRALNNLVDESGNNTGFGVRLVEGWEGANNLGPTTGSNSGVYPDNVLRSFYYEGTSGQKHISLSGFSTANRYTITLYGGRGGVTDNNRITLYTIGGVTKQLNCASNTTQTVEFAQVQPDANGQILLTVQKEATALYSYLNAMVITYPFDTTFYAPVNVRAVGISKDKIKVDWVSGFAGATSYQVYRSSSIDGAYSLLTTVAAPTTTYTNIGLTAGASWFYKIKAIAGPRVSDFSEVAGASTVAYTIDLNLNDGSSNPAQPGNWNNTNVIFTPGFILPNMINQLGQPTGISYGLLSPFTGYNIYGQVTGNNSGVYPDNVLAGFFYQNSGSTVDMKLEGLSLTSTYNLRFFGSRLSPTGGPVVSSYKVGNEIVVLDATDNTQNTVQINGIKPDSTGTIYFSMYATSGRAYLNALTIEGAPAATQSATTPFETESLVVKAKEPEENPAIILDQEGIPGVVEPIITGANKVSAYPNPVIDNLTLTLDLEKEASSLIISIIDMAGKTALKKEVRNVPSGTSQQILSLDGPNWKPGVYLVRIDGIANRETIVIKIIKR